MPKTSASVTTAQNLEAKFEAGGEVLGYFDLRKARVVHPKKANLTGDVFTVAKRSLVMAAIRSRGNKDTELKLAAILRAYGITGWRRHLPLPGRPDFVFQRARLAVFVDGCFWHGCPQHGRNPGSTAAYWLPKLARNRARDRRVRRVLNSARWKVVRLWQHDLKDEAKVAQRIRSALSRPIPRESPARRRAAQEGSTGK